MFESYDKEKGTFGYDFIISIISASAQGRSESTSDSEDNSIDEPEEFL